MLDKLKPPKLEIEDLCIPESDPIYHNAVRCVQTYWKQAANMKEGQRQKYLWNNRGTQSISAARDDAGNFVRLSWPAYLLLSSLYEDLPKRYTEAIEKKYGTSVIEDHATIYRHFYPTPTCTAEKSAMPSAFEREPPREPTPSDTQRNVKSEDEDPTDTNSSLSKDGDEIHVANRDPSSVASETASSRGPWNIDSVIDALAVPANKRSSSAPESPVKRTKLSDDEILSHVNRHTEAMKTMIHEAQLDQRSKLQEVHHEVEKGVQILNGMQNDLRQFMSAVASALKDIREHMNG
ncbi:hypothetical protein ACHAO4_001288 [Trichoderma viride]